MKFKNRQNSSRGDRDTSMGIKMRTVVPFEGTLMRRSTREPTEGLETFYILIWVLYAKVFLYIHIHIHIYKNASESYSILPITGFLTFNKL